MASFKSSISCITKAWISYRMPHWTELFNTAASQQQFNWHGIPDHEKKRRKHSSDPAYSPTMAGGLFSIDKAFFEKLGTYDDGFDIWGGENLELSFKVIFSFALRFTIFLEGGEGRRNNKVNNRGLMTTRSVMIIDLDVWRDIGDYPVLSRRPYLPQTIALQMAHRSQRSQAEQHPTGRSLAGWILRVLLPANWKRPGNAYLKFLSFLFMLIFLLTSSSCFFVGWFWRCFRA